MGWTCTLGNITLPKRSSNWQLSYEKRVQELQQFPCKILNFETHDYPVFIDEENGEVVALIDVPEYGIEKGEVLFDSYGNHSPSLHFIFI